VSEKPSEFPVDDFVFDPIDERTQRIFDRHQGELLVSGFLAEGYLKSRVRVEVRGAFFPMKVKPRYWIAVIERAEVGVDSRTGLPLVEAPRHGVPVHNARDDQQESVLVDDVQPVQSPKGTVARVQQPIPVSKVWLDFFECLEDVRAADARPELRRRHNAILWTEGQIADGELRLIRRILSVESDELPRQMVESRSQVVDGVSDNETPIRVDGRDSEDSVNILSALTLIIKGEEITVAMEDNGKDRFQIGQVALRPANLRFDALKRRGIGTHGA
jgi:hypothetical protein